MKQRIISGLNSVAISVLTLFAGQSAMAAPLSIAEEPLFLIINVSPNLILTLDDSGSMRRAYAPDGMSGDAGTRAFSSPDYNPLYYNPDIKYLPPVDQDNQPLSTTFTEAWENGFVTTRGDVNLATEYRTTRDYDSDGNWSNYSDPAGAPSNAYYYLYKATNAGCDGDPLNDDCYVLYEIGTDADERQNFANWYSFYRTRNLATSSAASLAFSQLSADTRVAWQLLGNNDCGTFSSDCDGWNNTNTDNRIARFEGGHRTDFYNWLFHIPTSGGTPLRPALQRAGEYYTTARPYEFAPGVTPVPDPAPVYACRQNYSILMTDGVWNGGAATGTANDNTDGTARTLPDGVSYTGTLAPYAESTSSTLADVAFHYWATDLRTTLADSEALMHTKPVTVNETHSFGGTNNTLAPYWNPKNDYASWQHMVTFTMAVGLTNSLNQTDIEWQGGTFDSNGTGQGYNALASGNNPWPAAASNSVNNVYDLWHTAINSRGEFFSAETPDEIVKAFEDIINRTEARKGSASNLSFNAGSVSSNTMFFQALFDSGDWSGHLLARPISDGKGAASGNPSDGNLTCTTEPRGAQCPVAWDAACQLTGGDCPDPLNPGTDILGGSSTPIDWDTERVMLTHNGSAGVSFRWSNLTAAQKALLQNSGNTDRGQAALNFIRGERACEESSTATCAYDINDDSTTDADDRLFRDRTNLLGDIVNSSPAYVGPPERGDYPLLNDWLDVLYGAASTVVPENSAAAADQYGAFMLDKFDRMNVAYVGSNDGMLHGFRAGSFFLSGTDETFNSATNDGQEVLAYMPSKSYVNLSNLVDPAYQSAGLHKFYADGQLEAVDAFFADNKWHSVLTAGMGAGGQGLFALDVTDPSTFSEANASDIVLWEYSDEDDADLGNTYGHSVLVRLHNGKYAVLVGNGYNNTVSDGNVSTTGNAVLFVLDAETGVQLAKLDTGVGAVEDPEGNGTVVGGRPNGLASVTPIDLDADVITDYAYAADLFGNVWRFDFTSDDPDEWLVSYNTSACPSDGTIACKPLFTATDTSGTSRYQPITTAVQADWHPKGKGYGVMVYFGTGKYFEDTDNMADLTINHSFYGVRDSEFTSYNTLSGATIGLANTPGTQYDISRSDLVEQKIRVEALDTTTGRTERVFTSNAPNNLGWYVDWLKGNGTVTDGEITDATIYTRQGEMVVADPVLLGDVIIVPTLIPNDDACSTGGSGWINVLNAETGGKLSFAPFYTKLGGEPVQGVYFGDAPPGTPAYISKKLYVPLGDGSVADLDFRLGLEGRKLWMELQ